MRETLFCAVIGVIGGVAMRFLGGWDYALRALVILMIVDYITGLIVAIFFKKSRKSKSGALESIAGFKGLIKKTVMLVMVLIAVQLDAIIGWEFMRHAVIIALISNELISIVENAGLMGVPIPETLRQAIGILRKKEDSDTDEK